VGKLLLIAGIIIALFYFVVRKISKFQFTNSNISTAKKDIIDITVPTFILQKLLKKTLVTVGTGFLLLAIILLIASKFKVALILLPISFYLIGQFFLFNNHIKSIKNQDITYNTINKSLVVRSLTGKTTVFTLTEGQTSIKEFKSVQQNNGLLMGYFELSNNLDKCYISYFVSANPNTQPFIHQITSFHREVETKLFPVI